MTMPAPSLAALVLACLAVGFGHDDDSLDLVGAFRLTQVNAEAGAWLQAERHTVQLRYANRR